ncbi:MULTISPECIES: hypothetical protein [unclassified Streptomyces]|uniref:hypothetical protein n=1 Tax=unclassified Streptomyces TaxID=2593676 RepID=UPI00224E48B5|nr:MULTISPECIES: hypothetical protein [unclassified Streptomyces]MCX5287094.1 hypothetical protein [Streptomyces sp. NBC_00183]
MLIAGVVAGVMLVGAGCSEGPHHGSAPGGKAESVNIGPGHAGSLRLPTGLEVDLPAGSVAGPGTLTGAISPTHAPAPTGMTLAGPVYDLHVSGTTLTGSAKLTVPVPPLPATGASAGPDAALLAFYDTAGSRWQPVAATYDPGRHTLTATSTHLSTFGVQRLDAAHVLTAATSALKILEAQADATAQPSCPNADQLTTHRIQAVSDKGNLIKWCAGVSDAGAPLVQVANNRSYAVEVRYPATWSMRRLGPTDPIFQQLVTLVTRVLSPPPAGTAAVVIPAGHTVELTAPPGTSGEVRTRPSPRGYLIDAFLYGVDTFALTLGQIPGAPKLNLTTTEKALALVFTSESCLTSMDTLTHTDLSSAHAVGELFRADIGLAVGCLGDQWPIAYGSAGSAAQFYSSVLLWLPDGIKLVAAGRQAAFDNVLYWPSYRIDLISPQAVPVLGVVWGPYQQGYGQPHPAAIFNGGDPTGRVTQVVWHSWGKPTAEGDGISLYAPGIVANGTEESTHVVAFDLGMCRGTLAYRAVEWYFPQHGQRFNPHVYIDICKGTFVGQ